MGWDQYRDIRDSAIAEAQARASQEPTDCPNDGTQLQAGPNGELYCPFDGFIWKGETVTW